MDNKEFLSTLNETFEEWHSIREKLKPIIETIKSTSNSDEMEEVIEQIQDIFREYPIFFNLIYSANERIADPKQKKEKGLDIMKLTNEFIKLFDEKDDNENPSFTKGEKDNNKDKK
jgi:hypothetical protein